MKRVEANISPKQLEAVLKAIGQVGVGGIMVRQSKGVGAKKSPTVDDLVDRTIVTTIVEDEKADEIMEAVSETCCTDSKGDGKIYVSNVEEMTDICTKEKEIFQIT